MIQIMQRVDDFTAFGCWIVPSSAGCYSWSRWRTRWYQSAVVQRSHRPWSLNIHGCADRLRNRPGQRAPWRIRCRSLRCSAMDNRTSGRSEGTNWRTCAGQPRRPLIGYRANRMGSDELRHNSFHWWRWWYLCYKQRRVDRFSSIQIQMTLRVDDFATFRRPKLPWAYPQAPGSWAWSSWPASPARSWSRKQVIKELQGLNIWPEMWWCKTLVQVIFAHQVDLLALHLIC